MTRTVRLQVVGAVILGLALLALAIQVIGGTMWQELGREFARLSVT